MKMDNKIIQMQIDGNTIIQSDSIVFVNPCRINGEILPPLPNNSKFNSVAMINGKIFVNGYEWKNGQWKRTIKSIWHLVF